MNITRTRSVDSFIKQNKKAYTYAPDLRLSNRSLRSSRK